MAKKKAKISEPVSLADTPTKLVDVHEGTKQLSMTKESFLRDFIQPHVNLLVQDVWLEGDTATLYFPASAPT